MSTVVQATYTNQSFTTSHTHTFSSGAITSGNTVVFAIRSAQTVTLTGIWASATEDITTTGYGGSVPIRFFRLKNVTTGPTGITFTTAASTGPNVASLEIEGGHDLVTTNRNPTSGATNGAHATVNVSATAAGQVVFAFGDRSGGNATTADSGFTAIPVGTNWEQAVYKASTAGAGTETPGHTWTGNLNWMFAAAIYEASAASYSLSVDNASAAVAGQSATFPVSMAVVSGSAAGEGQNVSLLFDEAYVISLSHAQAVVEPQPIPFILSKPFDDAAIVVQGQSINLLTQAVLPVEAGQATVAGQDVTLTFEHILPVVAAQAVVRGSIINLIANPEDGAGSMRHRLGFGLGF